VSIEFFNRNIPDECHQKMNSFAAAGDDVLSYAVGADTVLREAYMKALKPKP
jgi:hypothetical protein